MSPDHIVRRHAALMRRVSRRYDTVEETVRLGELEFGFRRVRDPDAVLDLVADEESRRIGEGLGTGDISLPYWAALWDSAYAVGQWLVKQPLHANTLNVLDLGCGMGLTGVTALALGARVLFADIDTHALLFAELNSLPWSDRARVRRTDWQLDHLGETFDMILGADILYERIQRLPIETFLRRHLAAGGRAVLGEPGRATGDDFPAWAKERGWSVRTHEEEVSTRPRPVRVFEITR